VPDGSSFRLAGIEMSRMATVVLHGRIKRRVHRVPRQRILVGLIAGLCVLGQLSPAPAARFRPRCSDQRPASKRPSTLRQIARLGLLPMAISALTACGTSNEMVRRAQELPQQLAPIVQNVRDNAGLAAQPLRRLMGHSAACAPYKNQGNVFVLDKTVRKLYACSDGKQERAYAVSLVDPFGDDGTVRDIQHPKPGEYPLTEGRESVGYEKEGRTMGPFSWFIQLYDKIGIHGPDERYYDPELAAGWRAPDFNRPDEYGCAPRDLTLGCVELGDPAQIFQVRDLIAAGYNRLKVVGHSYTPQTLETCRRRHMAEEEQLQRRLGLLKQEQRAADTPAAPSPSLASLK